MRQEVRGVLSVSGATVTEVSDLRTVARAAAVIYVTGSHTPRLEHARPFEGEAGWYSVNADVLERLPADGRVLHALPRGPELPTEFGQDPRVACFRQAGNGLYVRMALLSLLAQ